ncbi:MAG TPA: hypothetical protein VK764_01220 [Terracidiphilus sp.]|nr:hypothetical protein [Terracidiphilus sp.]
MGHYTPTIRFAQRSLQLTVDLIAMKRLVWARVGLVILTLGGLFSLYQVLFDLWMLAYPFADPNVWWTRFYFRLATTIIMAASWIALAVWLYRRRRPLDFASDKNMQSLGPELAEFVQYVIPEEEPAFVSDEATVWDISLSTQEELIDHCFNHYGVQLKAEDFKQPLSRLLPELQRRRTK